ncbi:uncharacterized protein F4812DRAFT_457467 [Daldinia caldariorum]|uniref:uncharacterized protein n=1 Tax=Daldinia caldariorum TaxID=326644 RepID=UPI002007ED45|nr:uncharacterized protein F4812DRAFT_457467 [Daldinia caldariorum]KAI1470072.1 hypothetical protein F4812DRAFT_457467 [Daldinia caldariorum]
MSWNLPPALSNSASQLINVFANGPGPGPTSLVSTLTSNWDLLFTPPISHVDMAVDPRVTDIIRGKKLRYCLCIDTKQWHLFEQVALPDATLCIVNPDGSFVEQDGVDWNWPTRADFINYLQKTFGQHQTMHNAGAAAFEQVSPDEVKVTSSGIWHLAAGETQGTGGGYYYETWVRKDDDWFMKSMRLERTNWYMS